MTSILIMTHGEFGTALLATAELMLGPQASCTALSLKPEMGREDLAEAARTKLSAWGGEVLILVDMLGGTPWNAALSLGLGHDREVLSGASLPLVLEALSLRGSMNARELGAALKGLAAASVAQASTLLPRSGA